MRRGIFGVILLLTLIASLEAWTAEVPLDAKGKFTWIDIPGIASIGGSFTFKGSIDNNTLRGEGAFDGILNFQYDLLPEFSIPIYAERVSCQYDKGKRQVKFEVRNVGIPGVVTISISFEINHSWWEGNIEINVIGIITLNGPVGGTVQKFELRSKPYLTKPSDPRAIGGGTDEYEFVVAYHDLSGEEPEWVELVLLQQVCALMTHATGDPSSPEGSIYKARYSLQCGSEVRYYFEAGYRYGTVRLPESGYFSFTPPCKETCELSVTADPIDTLEDTASEFRVHANPSDNPTLKFGIDQYPSHGEIRNFDSTSGTGTYVPEEDYNGQDVFKVYASIKCGGKTLKETAKVQVQIEPVDDPPEVREGVSLTIYIPQNTPKRIYLKDYVWDKDNNLSELSFRITQYPKHGKVEGFNDDTGELTYKPNHNWHGTDYLGFMACDGKDCSKTITLKLLVDDNQAPKAYSKDVTVKFNKPKDIQLEAEDPEHDPLTFGIKTPPSHGRISNFDSDLGSLTYTPNNGYFGSDKFEFEVSDSSKSDTAWIYITVTEPQPPVADAGGGYCASAGEKVTLDGSGSYDPDGDIENYLWDLDEDGQFDDATGVRVTYVWNSSGTYTVSLKVMDSYGLSDTDTAEVIVDTKSPPKADFTFSPSEVYVDTDVQFTDRSSDGDGQIVSWHWDFGDGSTSDERNPVHKFGQEGVYEVQLTVTDNDGLKDMLKKTIKVRYRPPKAISKSYTLDEDNSILIHLEGDEPGLTFEIVSYPAHGKLEGTPPDVTYIPHPNYYGTDSFKFVVYDVKGVRSDPGTISFTVNPVPDPPDATPWQTAVRKGQQIEFTLNATDVDSTELTFSIVDGPSHGTVELLDPSTGKVQYKPDPEYRGLDSFTFKVTDETGLYDTAQIKINVGVDNAAPIAQFTYSLGKLQVGHTVIFNASSSYDPEGDAIVKYEWDFGDGNSAEGVKVSHVYNKSGTYKVTLTVTDEWNGKGKTEKTLFIKPYDPGTAITATFDFSPKTPEVGEEVTFDASASKGSSGSPIKLYKWDFGDGTKATGKQVKHTYSKSGYFTIRLLVRDANGREERTERNLFVEVTLPPPPPPPPPPHIPPQLEEELSSPGTLRGRRCPDGTVMLQWDTRTPFGGYTVIERKKSFENNFEVIGKTTYAKSWKDRDAKLCPGCCFNYRVKHVINDKASEYSNIVTVCGRNIIGKYRITTAVYAIRNGQTLKGVWLGDIADEKTYNVLKVIVVDNETNKPIENAKVQIIIHRDPFFPNRPWVYSTESKQYPVFSSDGHYWIKNGWRNPLHVGEIKIDVKIDGPRGPMTFSVAIQTQDPYQNINTQISYDRINQVCMYVGGNKYTVLPADGDFLYGKKLVVDEFGNIPCSDFDSIENAIKGANMALFLDNPQLENGMQRYVCLFEDTISFYAKIQVLEAIRDIAAFGAGAAAVGELSLAVAAEALKSELEDLLLDPVELFEVILAGSLLKYKLDFESYLTKLKEWRNKECWEYAETEKLYYNAKYLLRKGVYSLISFLTLLQKEADPINQALDVIGSLTGGVIEYFNKMRVQRIYGKQLKVLQKRLPEIKATIKTIIKKLDILIKKLNALKKIKDAVKQKEYRKQILQICQFINCSLETITFLAYELPEVKAEVDDILKPLEDVWKTIETSFDKSIELYKTSCNISH